MADSSDSRTLDGLGNISFLQAVTRQARISATVNIANELKQDEVRNADSNQQTTLEKLRIAVGIDKKRVRRVTPTQYVFEDIPEEQQSPKLPVQEGEGTKEGHEANHIQVQELPPPRLRSVGSVSRLAAPPLVARLSAANIFENAITATKRSSRLSDGYDNDAPAFQVSDLDAIEVDIDSESTQCMQRYHRDFIIVFGMNAIPDAVAFILAPLYLFVQLDYKPEQTALVLAIGKVSGWLLGLAGELGSGRGFVLNRPHDTVCLFCIMALMAAITPSLGSLNKNAAALPLIVMISLSSVVDGSTAETLHRLAFGLNRPSGESFTRGRNIFMFIAAVCAIALPLLYGLANQPELIFYLAAFLMLFVAIRIEISYFKISKAFDRLRKSVEEAVVSPSPQSSISGKVYSPRSPSVRTNSFSSTGDIGKSVLPTVVIDSPSSSPSPSKESSAVEGCAESMRNMKHPPPLNTALESRKESLELDVTDAVIENTSDGHESENRTRLAGMKIRLGVSEQDRRFGPDGAHSTRKPSLIGVMQQSRRLKTRSSSIDEAAEADLNNDTNMYNLHMDDGKVLPWLTKPASRDRALGWAIVALYPIIDSFMTVLLTVWMPVELHKQFNDNADTATIVIAVYALIGLAGQFIQSNPICSPVESVNTSYDHCFHSIPVIAYFLATLVVIAGKQGGSADYWFIPVLLAALCETMGIQQKYLMVYFTGRPTYDVDRVSETVADSLRLRVKRSHMFNSLGGVISFIASSAVYDSYGPRGALLLGLVVALSELLTAIYIDRNLPWLNRRQVSLPNAGESVANQMHMQKSSLQSNVENEPPILPDPFDGNINGYLEIGLPSPSRRRQSSIDFGSEPESADAHGSLVRKLSISQLTTL